ncbi:hypothetical protein Daura_50020 [Dactylosporangium aurantiacum]|uniref:Uncharacterized protein n=1 Tax=Dactylosporangium aurantiacum TaxID=35754 RepID=A0A9Q9IHY5_9ACTN|nr:hypothetical protein [Dactylosporangium aurantiacum]MDG6107386.1 hypothetical protein [Dactylosporangium aurantiacum]UWZ54485.1 hypothetical protein Daura_50020 [Dactylosporangium aurantiacum]
MTQTLLAVLVLLVAGLPLGYAFTRAVPLALVLAPVAGAAVATAAVLLMLAFTGPLLLWFVPVYLATGYLAWRLRDRPRLPVSRWRDAALTALPLVPPLLRLGTEPVNWDTHLIWWLHAGYFTQGGDFARESIGNPVLVFSHPDYPPLASAPVALVWQLLGIRDFYPAGFVTGFLNWSAIAMLVYAVRVATVRGRPLLSWPAAIATGYAAWTPLWVIPTAGFSDAMCACAFAAGAVLVLFARPWPGTLPLALLLLSASALMKNEGLSLVVALALVGTVRWWRDRRRAALLWLPVGVAGIWSVTARLLGAETDVLAGGRFSALLHGDADTLGRLPMIIEFMAGRVGWILLLTLAAALLGHLLLRRARAGLELGADGWLWAVTAVHTAGLIFIYLITPYDIHWHLSTSVDRVVIAVAVLACASAACWGVTALTPDPVAGPDPEPAGPDPLPAREPAGEPA